ncbi:hypothetical protein Tco_0892472 [Tanacetum coccineum]|uniref:Integrase, catalytic region, zinc finger, CCHC-type, peptidase aspartic, catalytic n=1 Tax=Tanacetum coccineum TaxID=301880 RepID=A0ABQ5C6B5_9ASTR
MTKQERKSMLYDEFNKFTSEPGESIHSYYLRFAKLINDMNMIPMSMTPMKINTKFVNHLQPEWSSYAPTVVQQLPTFQPDTGLAILTFLPTNDPIASLNKAMIFLSWVYRSKFPPQITNFKLRLIQELKLQFKMAKLQLRMIKCTARKRVKDYEWFKEKMLLAQAQEPGVVLDEEQQDFLADNLEETDDYCNDKATSNTIFMVNLSPIGSLNDDMVAPHYDSDTLSEVPHYDTYHDSNVLNFNIQELEYIENIVSNNDSYDTFKGNNNVISYTDYMLTNGDDADNYVPPPIQKNDMMLFVIEQMKSEVEKCNKVNQESKSMNESLTCELERYKDRVRVLEYVVKDGHSEQEAYLSRELHTLISQCKRQVSEFQKKVFSQQTQMKDLNNHIAFLKKIFETLIKESSEKYEKNIIEIVDLEKAKKELENIVFKMEQLYWSSIPSPLVTVSKPKVFPKKLLSTSQVLRNLNKARDLLNKFDECIKRRTTLSPHEIGSWEQSDIKISENNKLRAQLKGKFYESQMNHNGTSVNTKLSKPSTSGTKLYSVTLFPKSKVISKVGLLKIESEPINAYFKNNRAMHHDYLKVTKEHVSTLQELLEEARALKPLDDHIGHASKFTE